MRLFLALLACAAVALPQDPKPSTPATVREKYTKYEFEIPMRDVCLPPKRFNTKSWLRLRDQ